MSDKEHKCTGVLRTPKGDRLLAALASDHNNEELVDTVQHMRKAVPAYADLSDAQIMELLAPLIAKIPKKCPECDGSND